jgi:hypothetical protein
MTSAQVPYGDESVPTSIHVAPLADPPRRVPAALRLGTFAWSWWEVWSLLMGLVTPVVLYVFWPETFSIVISLAALLVVWFRVRRFRRVGLLAHGKVATVTGADVQAVGTYYSGVTMSNMRVAQAHGWKVTRRMYSGPSTTTKISYQVDGASGSLRLRGLPYAGGVVLADPRHPERAAVVSQLPFSFEPGPDGQLVAEVSAWQWVGVFCALLLETTLVCVAVLAVYATWF